MDPKISSLHAQSMKNIDTIKQLLAESDETGARTLEQLSADKEKLLKLNRDIDTVNEKVSIGRRIIRKIGLEDDKKKIIIGATTTAVVAAAITTAVIVKK
jgi:hypothetical protein